MPSFPPEEALQKPQTVLLLPIKLQNPSCGFPKTQA